MNEIHGRGFWEFFVFHRRFTIVLIFVALTMGLFSIVVMPKESNPEVNIPIAIVTIPFPGASAEDVEELVTDVVEDKIINLEDISEITSNSNEGLSSVVVEFNAKADSDKKLAELKDKIDEIGPDLPDEARDPIITKVRFSDEPILIFSMSGPYQIPQLKYFAEDLKEELERIKGVSRVGIVGGQEREIQVLVNKKDLDGFGLNIAQVTGAIASANVDIPTGSIETAGAKYNLRLTGRLDGVSDIRKIPVAIVHEVPVFVGDVAKVIDSLKERTTTSKLSLDGNALNPAINISIFKSNGGNILRIEDKVFETIEKSKEEFIPPNILFETIINDAQFIREDLTTLTQSGIATILLVMMLLFLFLGYREALLAGIAIPLSFLITFVILLAIGSTINFLTLFSLILALGILIDSAIVIVEGMNRYVSGGYMARDAACYTLRFFKWPLIAGTLTTIFAFVPMLLMSGILGEFVKHIPITVTIVLSSSLFVALAIIPTLGAFWLKFPEVHKKKSRSNKFFESLSSRYRNYLKNLLNSSGKQRLIGGLVVLSLFASLTLPAIGAIKVEMFPADDFDFFLIDYQLPIGTPLEATENVAGPIAEELLLDERIKSFSLTVGSASQFGGDSSSGSSGTQSHLGNFFVNLVKDRDQKSFDIAEEYRGILGDILEIDFSVTHLSGGPPTGAPIEIRVTGKSLTELEEVTEELASVLSEIPNVVNVDTTVPEPTGEFLINIDRAKAQLFGISTIDLARILRNAVSGTKATVIRKDGDEIEVVVRYILDPTKFTEENPDRVNITDIQTLTIATPKGDVPLSEFTTLDLSGTRPNIQHKNGERIMRVLSDVSAETNAQSVFLIMRDRIKDLSIPESVTVSMGGETEDLEQSYMDMFRAMILAIFLIAGALVLQFNSFRQPLFILATIPLSFIGVFIGLLIMNMPVSFPGIIGMVALVGIVVNNAIILMASANDNRRFNMDKKDAVIEAAVARMRPILLTTITTVIGIIPITLSSAMWGPLGVSIIFGLTFSTILTLFIVPMLYNRYSRDSLDS